MRFFLLCPANTATGGPELLHQYCDLLSRYGIENYMVYVGAKVLSPTPERFRKYNVKYVTEYVDDFDSVLVLPETMIHQIDMCKRGKVFIWWLSVNNYVLTYNAVGERQDLFGLKYRENVVHFVQSQYAKEYLMHILGIEKCYSLKDYINDEIVQKGIQGSSDGIRNNYVLYNPKKGYDKILKIKEKCRNDIEWVPIVNLTPAEIVELMIHSRVYIDFGEHPGKDRIPREAAICGCNILTNRNGSADYYEDVPIPDIYKCENTDDVDAVLAKIYDMVDNYSEHKGRFEEYRIIIQNEKEEFVRQALQSVIIMDEFINSTNANMCNSNTIVNSYSEMLASISKMASYISGMVDDMGNKEELRKSEAITTLLNVEYMVNLVREASYSIVNRIISDSTE